MVKSMAPIRVEKGMPSIDLKIGANLQVSLENSRRILREIGNAVMPALALLTKLSNFLDLHP